MNRIDRLADPDRLAVLHNLAILETPAEPDFDDVARLASVCCRSSIGAVNFVDADRHWTKAIVGVENGQGASVPADVSFCAATICTPGGLLTLPDTTRSEEWRSHPFVTGPPFVRHYAGAAILASGQPVGVICVFGDESHHLGQEEEQALVALARQASTHLELRQRNFELRELAVRDPLTRLSNRALLFDRLEIAIAQSDRDGTHVGVLFCDVNDFKQVNDRWGHEAGDRLLCQIADRLRMATRDTDTVARFAGDEFVIVCPGLESPEAFATLTERVDRTLHSSDPSDVPGVTPRVSVGAVLLAAHETAADVLARADAAMYTAKRRKRLAQTG